MTEDIVDPQAAIPVELRTLPASEWLATIKSPGFTEQRMEAILALAPQFGMDTAREMMETLDARRRELIAVFGEEKLSPQARYMLSCGIDAWFSTRFDWAALTAAHAESIGKAVEEVVDFAAERHSASKETNIAPVTVREQNADESEDDDESDVENYGLPPFMSKMVIRAPLVHLDNETQLRHTDTETGTSFLYERFAPRPDAGQN